MKKVFCLLFVLLVLHTGLDAQFLSNPSFEGPVGGSVIPPGWVKCDQYSTPDTQPGAYSVNNKPSNGNTFMSLVCRGEPADNSGHSEDAEAELITPVRKGKCYRFKIDVCSSKTFMQNVFGDDYFYTNPMILKIFLDTAYCAKNELIYQSGVISNADWETISFVFIPKRDYRFLYLQSDFAQLPFYFGNVLVDNIRITEGAIEDYVKLDTVVDYGSTVKFTAGTGLTYNWLPPEGLSCSNCPDPSVTSTLSSTYTVEITNSDFCYNHKEYFKIKITPFIPNVITPDGDGWNDSFRILGLEPNSSLVITNRQGEVLYQTDNYDNTWNGYYKGALLPPDTYWFLYKPPSAENKLLGFIYLKQTK